MFIFLPEHRITFKVLKILKPDHIRTILLRSCNRRPDQAIFESNLEIWKKETCVTLKVEGR